MSDIIKRAETVMRLSDPRRTQPHIIGVIAELVKALKESVDRNHQLESRVQHLEASALFEQS